MRNIFFFLFFFIAGMLTCQPYKKELTLGLPWQTYEAYDKGFYLLTLAPNGILLKIDANGNILWQRELKSSKYYMEVEAMYPTDDGGLLLSGLSLKVDNTGNFYLLKLNACGEKEWCTDYDNDRDGGQAGPLMKNAENYLLGADVITDGGGYGSYFTVDTVGNIINQFHINKNQHPYRYFRKINNNLCYSYSNIYTFDYLSQDTIVSWIRSCAIGIDNSGNFNWLNIIGVDSNYITQALYATDYKNGYGYGGSGERVLIDGKAFVSRINEMGNFVWIKHIGPKNNSHFYGPPIVEAVNYVTDSNLFVSIKNTELINFNEYYTSIVYLCDTALKVKDSIVYGDTGNAEKYRCMDFIKTSDGNFLMVFEYTKKPGYSNYVYLQKVNSLLKTVNFDTIQRTYDWKCGHVLKTYDSINIDDAKKVTIQFDSSKFFRYVYYPVGINQLKMEYRQINTYPNPVNDILNIQLDNMKQRGQIKLCIYDVLGKEVFSTSFELPTSQIKIDMQNFAKGQYYIKLQQNNQLIAGGGIIKN